jgi:hypothetical protein
MTIGRIKGPARRVAPAALTAALAGAALTGCWKHPVADGACTGSLVGTTVGTVADSRLEEVSGIAASARNTGTLWMHNDSGDQPRVYAVGASGATDVAYTLAGTSAEDWEDMAIGPGPVPGESYLYVGDIGDNDHDRSDVVVYRVPEPTLGGPASQSLDGVDALTLRYPDGPRNAEALFVDPTTGELYLIEKSSDGGPVDIYSAPANLAPGRTIELTRVGTLDLPDGSGNAVTGAAITSDGTAIAVRTYDDVRIWSRDDGQSIVSALDDTGCEGPEPDEPQGEAVTFRPDGNGYYTVSEGDHAAIHRYNAQ